MKHWSKGSRSLCSRSLCGGRLAAVLSGAALAGPLAAQSFVELTEVRNPSIPYSSIFEAELGAIGTVAAEEDPTVGLKDEISWDGHLFYRDDQVGSRNGTVEAYAGRDGLYAGLYDGKLVGDDTVSRLELHARPWQFYRDGSYNGDNFAPNGLYEGSDYEAYLGFGREAQPGIYVEMGPYYRVSDFSRSDLTSSAFTIPDGFSSYGGRLYLEQKTVQMDRRRGMARDGYVITLIGEQEWNDSEGSFGATTQTVLPGSLWRARGRLEWYVPSSDSTVFEIFARGGMNDAKDRVENAEAQKPLGHQWIDANVRLRIHLGASWTVTPFVQGQFSKLRAESGGSDAKTFFGGGVESYFHFNEAFSLHGWYSYLNNESRPSIAIDEDVHGEHMFYLGFVMRFGAQRT